MNINNANKISATISDSSNYQENTGDCVSQGWEMKNYPEANEAGSSQDESVDCSVNLIKMTG